MTPFAAAAAVRQRLAARMEAEFHGGILGSLDVAALDDLPAAPCAVVLPATETSSPSAAPAVGSYSRRVAAVEVHVVVQAWPTGEAGGGTGQLRGTDTLGDLVTQTRDALTGWRPDPATPSTDALHLASGRLYAAEAGSVHWVDSYELSYYEAAAPDC